MFWPYHHQKIYRRDGHTKPVTRAQNLYSAILQTILISIFLFSEATNGRALNSASYDDGSAMTDESCINFCNGKGYNLAGTEYSAECCKSEVMLIDEMYKLTRANYIDCGNTFQSGSTVASDSDCSMACTGNSAEACGGPNRLTVFTNGKAPPPAPVNNPGPPGWSLLGCYT